jgi:integrase
MGTRAPSPTKDENGDTKRYVAYGRTRKDVRDKLDTARERLKAGAPVRDATSTVGNWSAHWRATALAASDRKDTTKTLYANLSRCHLEPAPFGAIPLDRLKPSDIDALVLAMRAKTKPGRGEDAHPVRALSDSTIRQIYTVLRAGLDGAVRDQLIARNPAVRVTRPGVHRRQAKHLDASGVASVLKAAQSSRYYPALALIVATGLRKGEALALSWDKNVLNLEEGWVKVRQTVSRIDGQLVFSEPKTQRSRRTVPLSPAVVAMLRKHCTDQKGEKLRAGNQWKDSGFGIHYRIWRSCGPAQPAPGGRGRGGEGRHGKCRRPHPASLGGGGLARGGRAYQSGGRPARAFQHLHNGRCLRAHQRRHRAGCGGRLERGAGTVAPRYSSR